MSTLPSELIREIILVFVDSRPSQAVAVATISRDVYEWVQPVLAKTLMYYRQSRKEHWPVSMPELPQWLKRNGKYVRNVMWGIDVNGLPEVLSQCPDITNLAVWVDVDENDLSILLPSLSTLHLTHFSINLYQLFEKENFRRRQAEHDVFRTITHLDVFHTVHEWQDMDGVPFLPCLTHLCVDEDRDVIDHALQECKQLKVLLVATQSGIWYNEQDRLVLGNSELVDYDDPRLVAVKTSNLTDWECGVMGGKDVWTIADEVIEQRRNRGIN